MIVVLCSFTTFFLIIITLQDLKMCQWDIFFEDTYAKCLTHLGDFKGHWHFALLASQMAQKLVKSVAGGIKPTMDHTKFLLGFVTEMFKKLQTITPDASGNESAETAEYTVVNATKIILDFKSPPASVLKAKEMFEKQTSEHFDHWLVQAMCLDRGRKIVESAVANAKSRELQSGVLESISQALKDLEGADLLNDDVFAKDGVSKQFTDDYGKLVASAHKILQEPGLNGVCISVKCQMAGALETNYDYFNLISLI